MNPVVIFLLLWQSHSLFVSIGYQLTKYVNLSYNLMIKKLLHIMLDCIE